MATKGFDAAAALRHAGYRATPGRIKLLEALEKERRPMTVEQIHRKLGRSAVNVVTLYRAIEALVAAQVMRRVNLRQEGAAHYYELADGHHHHIVCTKCDRVEDFADNDCEELVRKAADKSSGFRKITSHSIEIFGVCKRCAAPGSA